MSNPTSQAAEALAAKKQRIQSEVDDLEKRIYELETAYCGQAECTAFGTVTKGFEGFLTSKNAQIKNKGRTFRVDERLFSLSSAQSQAARELQAQKEVEDAQYDRRNRSFATLGKSASGRLV